MCFCDVHGVVCVRIFGDVNGCGVGVHEVLDGVMDATMVLLGVSRDAQ